MSDFELYLGDCLDILPTLNDGSVDAIIGDIPYGTTACAWDEVIPLEPMWEQVKHVLKDGGVFVTTASQPFTSKLVMSNAEWFKYSWVWEKSHSSNFLVAKYQPLKRHEDICVFSENGHLYNPQVTKGTIKNNRSGYVESERPRSSFMGSPKNLSIVKSNTYQPTSVLYFSSGRRADSLHPTQKPLSLYEYLILTYSNKHDVVLDFAMGSGTTGEACAITERNFIGIEIESEYFSIADKRIRDAQMQLILEI